MQAASAGRHRTKLERACVLYDRRNGTIRFIQHVIVMEGGHEPDEREIELMARGALAKRGISDEFMDALHVDREAVQQFATYRVDPRQKALVLVELHRQTRPGS